MKGSILDLAGILFLTCALIIVGFLATKIYISFKEKYAEIGASEVEEKILEKGDVVYDVLLSSIPIIIIGSGVGAIILAFLIPSHPVFLPISLIVLGIFVLLSTVFSNFLWEFLNHAYIVSLADQFPLVVNIVKYLPYIIAVFGFLLVIVMYSKSGGFNE